MVEMFNADPIFLRVLIDSILADGDIDALSIAFRQIDKAGLFSRTGVMYEVACDVIGSMITHYSEVLALEREKPLPDESVIAHICKIKSGLRLLRDQLDPLDFEAIKSVIKTYGPQARNVYGY
ncbi:hypothetical protein [Vogesella sp. XCS3]|uniref:hypothetical protein n=1 Tax=Vogesella sp. XCS3 TaxID=2877939 RepID=UPI001D0A5CE5|nr:hypothetical protein [Vogesella sp. XCS3]UDM18316.1 hypothetical protein LCH97_06540 [Vogesella sp. XCS3]